MLIEQKKKIINALYNMHQKNTQNLSITRKNAEKLPTIEGKLPQTRKLLLIHR
jgi:hypothetical protein